MEIYDFYSTADIMAFLGEKVQSPELHISLGKKPMTANPLPIPFRTDNTTIMIILQGELDVKINLESYTAKKNDMLLFSQDAIIHILRLPQPVRYLSISFSTEFALKNALNDNDFNILYYLSLKNIPLVSLNAIQKSILSNLIERMYHVNRDEVNQYRKEILFHCFNLISIETMSVYKNLTDQMTIKTSRKKELVVGFLNLLRKHVRTERSVNFYAEKLHVTPGYLSKVLKEISNTSARQIIEDSVALEARDLLLKTSLSISEIAYMLNFSDQSFFGKFFKKKMKMTPKKFRTLKNA